MRRALILIVAICSTVVVLFTAGLFVRSYFVCDCYTHGSAGIKFTDGELKTIWFALPRGYVLIGRASTRSKPMILLSTGGYSSGPAVSVETLATNWDVKLAGIKAAKATQTGADFRFTNKLFCVSLWWPLMLASLFAIVAWAIWIRASRRGDANDPLHSRAK